MVTASHKNMSESTNTPRTSALCVSSGQISVSCLFKHILFSLAIRHYPYLGGSFPKIGMSNVLTREVDHVASKSGKCGPRSVLTEMKGHPHTILQHYRDEEASGLMSYP